MRNYMKVIMPVLTGLPDIANVMRAQYWDGSSSPTYEGRQHLDLRVLLQLNDLTERQIECDTREEYDMLLEKYRGKLIEEPYQCGFVFCGLVLEDSRLLNLATMEIL